MKDRYRTWRQDNAHDPQAPLRPVRTREEAEALARALIEARRRQREARQAIEDMQERKKDAG